MYYHLSDSMKTLAVELKCLLKEYLVFNGPLIREWCEVGEVKHSAIKVVFVPEEHAQCLLPIVAIFVFG